MLVSLFAGPGGMCMGAQALGIETVGIEWDKNACKTRRAAGLSTVEGDVRNYGPEDFPSAVGLMGGPPCQTFSVAGSGAGRHSFNEVSHISARMVLGKSVDWMLQDAVDERTALVLEPLRWVLDAHRSGWPYRTIVLEQVPTVLPVWKLYAEYFRGIGYSAVAGLVNAEEHGVPQTRKRALLVARTDGKARLPKPTHRRYQKGVVRDAGDPTLKPWRTLGDVVDRGVPYWVRSNYNTASTGRRGRRTSGEPAFTVTGCVMRNRFFTEDDVELPRITYGEAGAVQTFPMNYPWSGVGIHQQIGNAAPPELIRAVLSAATD